MTSEDKNKLREALSNYTGGQLCRELEEIQEFILAHDRVHAGIVLDEVIKRLRK